MLKFSGAVIWRLGSRGSIRKYSAPGATVVKTSKLDGDRISDKIAANADDERDNTGKTKGGGLLLFLTLPGFLLCIILQNKIGTIVFRKYCCNLPTAKTL